MTCELFVKTYSGAVALTMSVDARTRDITELSVDDAHLESLLVLLTMAAWQVEGELIRARESKLREGNI